MEKIYLKVDENLSYIKTVFENGIDLIQSKLELPESHLPVGLVYISNVKVSPLSRHDF